MTPLRVGQGLDVHAFSADPERPLVLGGVRIPEGPGLAGHSDADVVLHALCDALLGAAGLGDMGALFGSARPDYAGVASEVFVFSVIAPDVSALALASAAGRMRRPRRPRRRPRRPVFVLPSVMVVSLLVFCSGVLLLVFCESAPTSATTKASAAHRAAKRPKTDLTMLFLFMVVSPPVQSCVGTT
jgi:hypothetical protein